MALDQGSTSTFVGGHRFFFRAEHSKIKKKKICLTFNVYFGNPVMGRIGRFGVSVSAHGPLVDHHHLRNWHL